MLLKLGLVLLIFFSLTAASSPDCDELIKPLSDRSKVYGKWIFYAGTSDNAEHLEAHKVSTSSWAVISPIPDTDEFTMKYADRINGECVYGSVASSTSGNVTTVIFHFNSTDYKHVGFYLETCPDCVLWTDEAEMKVNGVMQKSKSLYLFTKTEKLQDSHLEVLKKQAKCLNVLLDFYFPETTNLCPESSNEAEQ